MISKYYSKLALVALAAASLSFAGCGGKSAESDLAKPGQEAYYQSNDGKFHKVVAGQKASEKQQVFYKDVDGTFRKKDTNLTAAARQAKAPIIDAEAASHGVQTGSKAVTIPSTQAVNLVAKPSGNSVSFLIDSSKVDASGSIVLVNYARWLNVNTDVNVTIEGHCDERGSREYNLALGEERANKVRDVLVANGVASHRIDTVSFGEERPRCTTTGKYAGEGCWSQNRRGDIVNR